MTCLISGGASGIGRAAALRIARRMPVVVADFDAAGMAETVALVEREGGAAVGAPCDVRRPADCAAAVAAAERLGPLTDVVSAAGILSKQDGRLGDCTEEAWAQVLAINLTGSANIVRAALPALERAGGGDIVLVASTAALIGRPGIAAYTVSKAGLLGLQHALVADYSPLGIRCNCVCPGPTETPMARPVTARLPNAAGRMARPDEVAAAVAWLTEDDSDWMIGAVLPLDCAETLAVSRSFA